MTSQKTKPRPPTRSAARHHELEKLQKSVTALEAKAERLGLPAVCHLIGVAGLCLEDRLMKETTGKSL